MLNLNGHTFSFFAARLGRSKKPKFLLVLSALVSGLPVGACFASMRRRRHCVVPSIASGQVHKQACKRQTGAGFIIAPATLPLSLTFAPVVGSEEARLRAGLRPPLKLYVPISGIQLSRRPPRARAIANGRNQ